MITSPQNEKLKLVRRLRERKYRDREGLFVTEGEDLIEAGVGAGWDQVVLLGAPDSGFGEEVEPDLLGSISMLGSGTRAIGVWRTRWAKETSGPVNIYLHGVSDPGNVGTVIRTAHALIEGTVILGPDCADPFSQKAVRASMGSVFGQPVARAGFEDLTGSRVAMVARGGSWPPDAVGAGPITICMGAERDGLPAEITAACDARLTIPLRKEGAESLNVAAAAAIVCERVSSPSVIRGAENA